MRDGGAKISIGSEETYATKPDLFDLRAAFFLILDGYALESIRDFCRIAKQFWIDEAKLLEDLRYFCYKSCDYQTIKIQFELDCDRIFPNESRQYKILFSSVLGDFLECVPHLHADKTLSEDDLYFNAFNPHLCEICGDEIEPGEPAYFRTDPSPAIRHKKCSRVVRGQYEYAFIDYTVKQIEYHEQVFRFNECCTYKLSKSSGITLKLYYKYGYSTDLNDSVIGIPFFGEFVMDFISGIEDYDLIKKYRPYHVYLEFLLKAVGVDEISLRQLGGYKYLLREEICHHQYPQIFECITNITLSEFMFDKYIHKLVATDMVCTIYTTVFKKIFQIMGILAEDGRINLNGITQSYSVNEDHSDADISIIVDSGDIYCVDFEKSVSFTEYFINLPDDVIKLLKYCTQFGADL